MTKLILVLSTLAPVAACVTEAEPVAPIELTNNGSKTDGSGGVTVTLTQDSPHAAFIFDCKEWTWCDIEYGIYGVGSDPKHDYAEQLAASGAIDEADRNGWTKVLESDLYAPNRGHYPQQLLLGWNARTHKFEIDGAWEGYGIDHQDGMPKGQYQLDVTLEPTLDHATFTIGASWK